MNKFLIAIKSSIKNGRSSDCFIANLLKEDNYQNIPNVPGAYIISSQSQKILYPNGIGRVI
ncbi:MAG: hypothetical protein ABJH98_07810 [Reichenbachiella sp.]|uniref:hypothetical protein n=1 Tax=Reichenbachiella sp. TaxID=2184521 RepID=UPI0032967E92